MEKNPTESLQIENRLVSRRTGKVHHTLWTIRKNRTINDGRFIANCFAKDITQPKQVEEALRKARSDLEERVESRTAELVRANEQLKKEIQDRINAEKALRESEERYRTLYENIPVGTIIVDHICRVTGYNLAKVESGGRLPNIGDLMYRDYAGKHDIDMHEELRDCIQSGRSKEFPDQHYEGEFLHIRISPFSDGAIISSINITSQKQAEEALRESERKYRALVETIPHGIQEIDPQGVITFSNKALDILFGYQEGGLIGKSVLDLVASDVDRMEMKKFLSSLVKDQPAPIPYLTRCAKLNGNLVDIQTDWNYKRDKNGAVIGFISIITDITNRLKVEEDKKKLEKQLHHSQKMEAIGTLAGGIAHDFNNILGSILLNTELAIDDMEDNHEATYALEQVLKGSHRAKGLVEQILTFSREAEIERRPLKIYLVVKETLKMLRAMLPATIMIRQEIAPDLGTILGDPTQIQQLVMNLCSNAAHAMRLNGGELVVTLSDLFLDCPPMDTDLRPGPYVRLAVSDIGCGIEEHIKDRIFDPFFTTKRPGEGTGLGLSVVHGIVINHEGAISFKSAAGKGTTFEVFLPIIKTLNDAVAPLEIGTAAPVGNEHILFVDDEWVVVDVNQRILERLGYQVTAVLDSQEALSIFRNHPDAFDLVITDMTMPRLTGAELAAKLIRIRRDIPIILCTGYSQLITPEKAEAIGIREFVMKPFDRKEIADLVRKVLDSKGGTASVPAPQDMLTGQWT